MSPSQVGLEWCLTLHKSFKAFKNMYSMYIGCRVPYSMQKTLHYAEFTTQAIFQLPWELPKIAMRQHHSCKVPDGDQAALCVHDSQNSALSSAFEQAFCTAVCK